MYHRPDIDQSRASRVTSLIHSTEKKNICISLSLLVLHRAPHRLDRTLAMHIDYFQARDIGGTLDWLGGREECEIKIGSNPSRMLDSFL